MNPASNHQDPQATEINGDEAVGTPVDNSVSAHVHQALRIVANAAVLNMDVLNNQSSNFPCIDYVLVYDTKDPTKTPMRDNFERIMRRNGLDLETQKVGERCFVKIYCPFKRLAIEAETVKLEMPLKGVIAKNMHTISFYKSAYKFATKLN